MRELKIEEQMDIYGGKDYWFTDYTQNVIHTGTDRKSMEADISFLRSSGHKVSGLRY